MKTFTSGTIFSILFVCVALTSRGEAAITPGLPAPPLKLRKILQAPEATRGAWEELKGKAVVIEFWATWCGGCVDNIPHLNELAEKFESRPLQFISITDETDIELVKRFLSRHPIRGWIAFDEGASTFKTYGIEGRPVTLLVDRNGIMRTTIDPRDLTAQALEDLLAGKEFSVPESHVLPALGLEPGAPPPLLQVLIRPAAPVAVSGNSPGAFTHKDGQHRWYGKTIRGILSDAYSVPEARVDAPEWCGQTRYDFSLITPHREEALNWTLITQALEAAFHLKLHKETKETRVYILRRADGLQPKLRPATTEGQSSHIYPDGRIEAIGVSIGRLADRAHRILDVEAFDETGLTGRYDFDLKWNVQDPTSIIPAIREQLGLELVLEPRKLEHVIVDSITEAKTW